MGTAPDCFGLLIVARSNYFSLSPRNQEASGLARDIALRNLRLFTSGGFQFLDHFSILSYGHALYVCALIYIASVF